MASFISFHQLTKEKSMFNSFIENYSVKFVIFPRSTEYLLVVFLYFSCFFIDILTMLLTIFYYSPYMFLWLVLYIYVFCHWSEGLFWQLILKLKNTLENLIYQVSIQMFFWCFNITHFLMFVISFSMEPQ